MNRTTKNKLFYALMVGVLLVVLLASAFSIMYAFPGNALLIAGALILIFIIPGRIQSYYWYEYFEGQSLQSKGKPLEALVHFEKFLKIIRERPGLKRLIWLSGVSYTRNIEVLTLNNMAICYLSSQNLEKAERALQEAIQLDPDSPLPYYNLSLVYQEQGRGELATNNLEKAKVLGYRRASIARALKASSGRNEEDESG
jgi:Tfp pilus assembly protein PilF